MQFFRKNFEKVALALFIVAVFVIGILLWRGVDRLETDIAGQANVDLSPTGQDLRQLGSDDFNALSRLEQPRVEWGEVEQGGASGNLVKPPGFIWCANEDCWHWIPANATECPFCVTVQGDGQEDEGETDEVDSDGDGIPDAYENEYEFLDRNNPMDAAEDEDGDFFSNYAEYRAGTDPSDPNSHPPLVTRLFLLGVQRDPFNARLQRVTVVEGRPKSDWDVQVDVFRDGDKRTQFTGLNKTVEVNGVEYTVAEVEHVVEERFNPSVNAKQMVDRSYVVLKAENKDPIKLVRGEDAYDKGDTARFILVLDPENRRRWRTYSVNSDETLTLVDTQGNKEVYSVQVRSKSLVVLRPVEAEDDMAYPIASLTQSRLQKLINSQRPPSTRRMPMDGMPRFDPGMDFPRAR